MKKGPTKKAAAASKDVEKLPYEPTPIEAEAIAAYRAAKETRGPRVKVSLQGASPRSTTIIRMHSPARWP